MKVLLSRLILFMTLLLPRLAYAECPDPEDFCPPPDYEFVFDVVDAFGNEKSIFAEDEQPYLRYSDGATLIGGPTWFFIKDPSDNNEVLGDENAIVFEGYGNSLPRVPIQMLEGHEWRWFLHEDGTEHAVWNIEASFVADDYGQPYFFEKNTGFSVLRGYRLNPDPITVTPEPLSCSLFVFGVGVVLARRSQAKK
ncbi:MAG: hypothetical protein MOGMAGMI_01459 [Candidatus Omnitrophica bacterium]|nr:hypothetical protein [Candidatus Omnitrophota bacterium]